MVALFIAGAFMPINIVRPATSEVISNRIFGCRFCSTEVNQALARRATQRFRYSIHDRMPTILSPEDYGRWLALGPADLVRHFNARELAKERRG